MPNQIQIEVCVESLESAQIAEQAGAHRIELNSAIGLGGLTPSLELLRRIKRSIDLPVVCMVRPRPGDFCYSHQEFELMIEEARALIDYGADGLAIGCLKADGTIDAGKLDQLRSMCSGKELVFHRAFDCTPDLEKSAEILSGVADRILTSGGESSAILGQVAIKGLQSTYSHQIQILPGSGINSSNAHHLLEFTGCDQVHGTFRSLVSTGANYTPRINFNDALGIKPNEKYESSRAEIEKTINNVRSLSSSP